MMHSRNRLWSLWDMFRFYAQSYAAVVNNLAMASTIIQYDEWIGAPTEVETCREAALSALTDGEEAIRKLPLSRVVVLQYERLIKEVPSLSRGEIGILLKELRTNLINDLCSAYCLIIPHQERERYEQRQPPFGERVASVFSDANPDIAAATRCLALGESTACVFHLMRVLELGLRHMATEVGLPDGAVTHENWKNVIDRIESEIRALEKLPKSAEKVERVKSLSGAAVQFRYFKDAWRNHVSHAHARYDLNDAELIWGHVKAFMSQMAKRSDNG